MTPEDLEKFHQLVRDMETLKIEVQKIVSILGGDLTGKIGLVQAQQKVGQDLYEKDGLFARVEGIEKDRAEKKAEYRGGKTVLLAFAGLVGWAIGKAIDYFSLNPPTHK